jgi:hypothetical protein
MQGALPFSGLVGYVEVSGGSKRLSSAQDELVKSISNFGLQPFAYPAGHKLVLFGVLLTTLRRYTQGSALIWSNSDVVLTRQPFDVPNPEKVYGFHRREVPSGEICGGVDMYYIPVKWWDNYLSKDIPELYLGASYVDWWISRAMEKEGAYENLSGYIDHVTHPQSAAAGSDSNPYYQKNFRSYNAWAKRNALPPIPAPRFLVPGIGHVWGVRHALQRVVSKPVLPKRR